MIYPIDQQIADFFAEITDPDTGEISELISEDVIEKKLAEINIGFDEKVEQLRNAYINQIAESEAIKAEKQRLAKRQAVAEHKAERTKGFLRYLLQGQPFQNGACKINYRKSVEVVCDDDFVEWAMTYAPDLLTYQTPKPNKVDIKIALQNGMAIDHASLVEKNNIQVK